MQQFENYNGFSHFKVPTFILLIVLLVVLSGTYVTIGLNSSFNSPTALIVMVLVALIVVYMVTHTYIKSETMSVVFQRFGTYVGVDVEGSGIRIAAPFTYRTSIDMRTQIIDTPILKVTDADSKPIEAGGNYKVKVTDPAKALFNTINYKTEVKDMCNTNLKEIVQSIPYESIKKLNYANGSFELDDSEEANTKLEKFVMQLKEIGLALDGFGITNASYAPEIAAAMLQKQQANAMIEAKVALAQGAVDISKTIKGELKELGLLGDQEQILMRNLLVTLVNNDGAPRPVMNIG